MKIAMIGTGYVGLVSGAGFAESGHYVVCVDKNANKVASLAEGIMPIYELGLDALVARNAQAGRLSFTTDMSTAVRDADAVFIAVGTPSRGNDGHADLSDVFDTAAEIAHALTGYAVIVTKSTVPVGTSRKIEEIIRSILPDGEFDVASNPEFLREGTAIEDFRHPDRVVVGCDTERARKVLLEVYQPHHHARETPMIFTTRETSELIKYAANAFLATKITFINEMADICEKVGGDVKEVARGMGLDRRIGRAFLNAGPGYGGSCFPKDTLALLKTSQDVGAPTHIVETVVNVNAARKHAMAKRIEAAFGGVKDKTVAVLGLTFKPDTDDMRDAPSLVIIPYLQSCGARIQAYDPQGGKEARSRLDLDICKTADDALSGADGVVILTEWKEFQAIDLANMKTLLKRALVVDLRNIYPPEKMAAAGFTYWSIGRPSISNTPDLASQSGTNGKQGS